MMVMAQLQTDLLRQAADLYPVASNPGMPLVDLGRADFGLFERDYSQYQNSGAAPVEASLPTLGSLVENVAQLSVAAPASSSSFAASESFTEYLSSQSPVVELLSTQRERRIGEPVAPSLELQLWVLQHGLDIAHPRA